MPRRDNFVQLILTSFLWGRGPCSFPAFSFDGKPCRLGKRGANLRQKGSIPEPPQVCYISIMQSVVKKTQGLRRAGGYTLVEMSVVIVIIGITAVAGLAAISSYNGLQIGLEGSADLREIYLAQKKMIVTDLHNPPLLAGYGSDLFTLDTLKSRGFLPKELKLETQGAKIDVSALPPTCNYDGRSSPFPNTAKNPLKAHSGDGLYDVGAEN